MLLIAILACVAVGVFFLTDPAGEESEESSVESSEESQETSEEVSEDPGSLEFIPLDGFAYAVSIGTYKGEHVKIPVTYNGWDVTQIAENGFAGSDIKSVYIPNSITVIGESARTALTSTGTAKSATPSLPTLLQPSLPTART